MRKFLQLKLFTYGIPLLLILAIPVTVLFLQTEQKTNSKASTQTAIPSEVCGTTPADIMILIDRSGSMTSTLGTTTTSKLSAAKTAASNFVDILSQNSQNRVGLTTFETNAVLNSKLTNNFSTVKSQINSISATGGTCTQCGAKTADDEVHADSRSSVKKVVILLTDGLATHIIGDSSRLPTSVTEPPVISEVQNAHATDGTIYFTIGLGNKDGNADNGIDEAFLQQIAKDTGGQYFYSPTTDDLNQIYQDIATIIGKGSISGNVFNDVNNNGILDTGEPNLENWKINLKVGSNDATALETTQTASDSAYAFTGLCDGTYYVSQEAQTGWTQTLPTNPNYYTVTIANGNTVANNNFGNIQRACGTFCTSNASCAGATGSCTFCNPDSNKCSVALTDTPTPTLSLTPSPTLTPTASPSPSLTPSVTPTASPSSMVLDLTASMDSIGNAGDNANPTASSYSNKTPQHPTRNVQAFVYDLDNNLVADPSGTILYSSPSGSFVGNVDLGSTVADGKYYVKVHSDYHLTRLIPGIQTLATADTNTLPAVRLVAGDANNDNQLDILDYNLILTCYSESGAQPANCTDALKTATDLNDDGAVNDIDYNLFIRELSVQSGE